ncbi:hypothetical protein D3C86_2051050 [compost metagenome]
MRLRSLFTIRSEFIYGLKIRYRQQMHMSNAQLGQMINAKSVPCGILQPEFSKSLEFALVPHARIRSR